MKRCIFSLAFILLLIGICTSTYAADRIYYEEYAIKLSEIDVFKGTGNGFELEREPTRLEGLIMLIRLLGVEHEANQLIEEPSVFLDVPRWGVGYVNYAYKHGLTQGVGNDLFGSNNKMNANAYITFLLRALGYDDRAEVQDFIWSEATDFAKLKGLLDEDLYFKIVSDPFIRDYVAKSSFNALHHHMKDSESTLLQTLVNRGVISEFQADQLHHFDNKGTAKESLTSNEIFKLAEAVVMIEVTGYDGSTWNGSGFYVSSDGVLVTNYHVIEYAESLDIIDNNDQVYSGSIHIIGLDPDNDIAVIQLDKKSEYYLELGDSDNVVIGEEIFTIGSPFGLKNTISSGIISSFREGQFQITAPISPGSSGGVLLNRQGLAIGITTSSILDGQNLGFAIPIHLYHDMNLDFQITLEDFYTITKEFNRLLSYEAYERHLLENRNSISLYGITTYFDDVYIDDLTQELGVYYFIDPDYHDAFLEVSSISRDDTEYELAVIASEIAAYYDLDVTLHVIYYAFYDKYPFEYSKNDLLVDPVSYVEDSGEWEVYYPYLSVSLYVESNTYSTAWDE